MIKTELMNYKLFGKLILIVASVLCIFVVGVVIFTGAYFIESVSDRNLKPLSETLEEFFVLLSLILFVFAVIFAWFKRLAGSLLLTVFAIPQIILGYEPEIAWLQITILFIGPLLYLCAISDKKLSNAKKN